MVKPDDRIERKIRELEQIALGGEDVAGFLAVVTELRRMLAMDASLEQVIGLVMSVEPPTLDRKLGTMLQLAAAQGSAETAAALGADAVAVHLSRSTRSTASGFDKAARAEVVKAQRLVGVVTDAAVLASPLLGLAQSLEARVTSGIVQAYSEGVKATTDANDKPSLWVSEVNACVHCLAYSGMIVPPGEKFPGGLTFGRRSYHPEPLIGPPLHPYCRCHLEGGLSPEYAAALRRESIRSVLRGYSLQSESMKTRIDAAARLLDSGVSAPVSVKKFAAAAVKRGSFATRGR